mgnify:CR=1 FL=1
MAGPASAASICPRSAPPASQIRQSPGVTSGAAVPEARRSSAIAASIARRPDINLYAPDKRHPSLADTYLSACTVYATLYRKSPVGLPYTAGLPADVATALQTAAWDTVQEYLAKP